MLKIWGRNTSSNVQKVMWAIGEMNLPHQRIDVGGAFGKTREAAYLAMNPNALVPTLEEEDGFTLWESNSIVRYLAARHGSRTLARFGTRVSVSKAVPGFLQNGITRKNVPETLENTRKWVDSGGQWRP